MPKYEVSIFYTTERVSGWEVDAPDKATAETMARETMVGNREKSDRCFNTHDDACDYEIDEVMVIPIIEKDAA